MFRNASWLAVLSLPKKKANFLRSVRLAGLLPFQPRHVEHDFHGLLRLLKKNAASAVFQTLAFRAAELNYKFYVYVLETRGSEYLRFSIRTSAKKAENKEEKKTRRSKQRRGGRAKFFMLEKKIVIIN